MSKRRLHRFQRRLLCLAAALPVCQFFSGCYPNIPGLPNIPGAISFEVQNLINRYVIETWSIIVANLLDL